MNLYTYETQIQNVIPFEQCMYFVENWTNFEQLTIEADTRELNLQINKSWKNAKRDGKKLWDLIDWHGKAEIKKETLIHDRDVDSYFRSIFQSENTLNHPTVSDLENIDTYEMHIPILDDTPQEEGFERATKKIGKGCGLDGIPAPVIRLLPPNLKYDIFTLIKNTFIGTYPEMWQNQILYALPKEGHNPKSPKLRGISIAPIFARIYDCILNKRFQQCYTPNREQAGFRSGQGCLLQIFIIVLLIHHSKEKMLNYLWIMKKHLITQIVLKLSRSSSKKDAVLNLQKPLLKCTIRRHTFL